MNNGTPDFHQLMYSDAISITLRVTPKDGNKPKISDIEFKLCIKKSEFTS